MTPLVHTVIPQDAIVQLFPGADLPETPVDALIELPNVWVPTAPNMLFGPGSMIISRPAFNIGGSSVIPFSLGMALPSGDADADGGDVLVAWWVPGVSPAATFRAGIKRKVVDIFGPWEQYDNLQLETASNITLPSIRLPRDDILLMNVEVDNDGHIPFSAFDALRTQYGIDVSAISLSWTHRGNLYRAHVLRNATVL